jgi:hypothetical protein
MATRSIATVVTSFLAIREKITGYSASWLQHAAWPDTRRPRQPFETTAQPLNPPFQSLIATLAAEGFGVQDVLQLIETGIAGYTITKIDDAVRLDFSIRKVGTGSQSRVPLKLSELAKHV